MKAKAYDIRFSTHGTAGPVRWFVLYVLLAVLARLTKETINSETYGAKP
jgi:hypothetical protein